MKTETNNVGLDNQFVDMTQDCPDEDEMQSKEAMNSETVTQVKKKKPIDDDEETFESIYSNLPVDLKYLKDCMHRAQGCCLLLILKFFLKEIYSISEAKIQNYSPTDTAKVNERPIMSRKTNRKFNPKQIIDYMLKIESNKEDDEEVRRSLVNEYLEFKELMLSIDQEESNTDESKNTNASKSNTNEAAKLPTIQQKLLEGIEKTKVS